MVGNIEQAVEKAKTLEELTDGFNCTLQHQC